MKKTVLRIPFGRLADVVCAAGALLFLLPVLSLIALFILCDDGAPVLFSQTRVGRNGKTFTIWKFRTMGAGLTGSRVTAAHDVRVTRIGRVLRMLKLDELPQLFNVLRGDMSVIGPRPEVPEYVQANEPLWQKVLEVKPGVTDLATLIHRNEERLLAKFQDPCAAYSERVLPAKLRLNVMYLHSRSFKSDLLLIFLTIRYCLLPGTFDLKHIYEVFHIGAPLNETDYLHSLSCSVDR